MEDKFEIEPKMVNQNGNSFPIRQLELSDQSKGFVELLGQLSQSPSLSESEFQTRFAELAALGKDHYICVIEDPISNRIVATGTIFIEKKFMRGCGQVGHIEDIVVDQSVRGARLGQRVIDHLVDRAKEAGCYKVILDCDSKVRGFYEKCGFEEKNVQMALYF